MPDCGTEVAAEAVVAVLNPYRRVESRTAPAGEDLSESLCLTGWRGERVNGQLLVWAPEELPQLSVTAEALTDGKGGSIPVSASMLRYTRAHGSLYADVIGNESSCDQPAKLMRPVWVQVDIPAGAAAGTYRGYISVRAEGLSERRIPVELEVDAPVLPPAAQRRVHLDLWQHPEAVARWHRVEPWSPEHFALMKPLMRRLADAGQKVITCTLIDEAWNGQTYDYFPSLIRWIKSADGSWRYDYSRFDAWVDFMMQEVGISEQISCYTMVPWSMSIRYYDEAAQMHRNLKLDVLHPSYEKIWGHFLSDFREHVRGRGWLNKTCIALDERPDALVRAAKAVIDRYAPEFRIVSAVDKPTAVTREVYDVSPILTHADSVAPELLEERRKDGRKTTFYVCLHPAKPNTFTFSPPAEAEWLGLFAAANNLDGFLRWAYNSWNRNPFETTDFVQWPSGDCFLVYPGNLSSVRFEHLRDGLEEFEKVGILRDAAERLGTDEAGRIISEMNAELRRLFTVERSRGDSHESDVRHARELIRRTAAALLD